MWSGLKLRRNYARQSVRKASVGKWDRLAHRQSASEARIVGKSLKTRKTIRKYQRCRIWRPEERNGKSRVMALFHETLASVFKPMPPLGPDNVIFSGCLSESLWTWYFMNSLGNFTEFTNFGALGKNYELIRLWIHQQEAPGHEQTNCGPKTRGILINGSPTTSSVYFVIGLVTVLLACDAFVRTNCRVIAMMFVRLSGTGVHCDHFSVDLNLWLGSPMFWTSWHQSMSTYSSSLFPVPPGREVVYGCAN